MPTSSPDNSFSFVHFSDIHLPEPPSLNFSSFLNKQITGWLFWQLKRRRRHSLSVLETLLADAFTYKPDHVVLSGDLVNLALPNEIANARSWLTQIGSPHQVSVVPGNHDFYVPGAIEAIKRAWRPWLADGPFDTPVSYPCIRRRGNTVFVLVNTAVPRAPFDATGRIDKEQLHRLENILRQLQSEPVFRIVVMHHPPVRDQVSWSRRLTNLREFQTVLSRAGAHLILFGHIHQLLLASIDGPDRSIPVVSAPSASDRYFNAHRRAGYHQFQVLRKPTGFTLIHVSRSISRDGSVETTQSQKFEFDTPRQTAVLPVLASQNDVVEDMFRDLVHSGEIREEPSLQPGTSNIDPVRPSPGEIKANQKSSSTPIISIPRADPEILIPVRDTSEVFPQTEYDHPSEFLYHSTDTTEPTPKKNSRQTNTDRRSANSHEWRDCPQMLLGSDLPVLQPGIQRHVTDGSSLEFPALDRTSDILEHIHSTDIEYRQLEGSWLAEFDDGGRAHARWNTPPGGKQTRPKKITSATGQMGT